jgi:hypothetical protein
MLARATKFHIDRRSFTPRKNKIKKAYTVGCKDKKPFFSRFWFEKFVFSQQEVIVITNVIKAHDWKSKKFFNCFVLYFFLIL